MEVSELAVTKELIAAGEYYDQVRRQIEHEDNLSTQRLSWLMASQSFLFTAFAIVLNGLQSGKPTTPLEIYKVAFCHLLPIAGILSSGLIYASICGGVLAIRDLKSLWNSHQPRISKFQRPPVQSSGLAFILGQSAPRLLPLALIGLWIYLLFGSVAGVQ